MNRIYQGRVNNVEIRDGNGNWVPLPDWEDVLWQHHELFHDAVSYYTSAPAACAGGAR
jgi:hypothetical protein